MQPVGDVDHVIDSKMICVHELSAAPGVSHDVASSDGNHLRVALMLLVKKTLSLQKRSQ